jgi:hypothetical protein
MRYGGSCTIIKELFGGTHLAQKGGEAFGCIPLPGFLEGIIDLKLSGSPKLRLVTRS